MTSGDGSSSSNGRVDGLRPFPPKVKKVLQSLKEIVKNSSDEEIYTMLKECNMDPNDAIQRLLSQDTFREVKSKREKKKEKKGNTESKFRAMGSATNRGSRIVSAGNAGASQFSSSESGVIIGKPVYKKESGANHIPSSSASARKNVNHSSTAVGSLTMRQISEQMTGTLPVLSDFPPVTSQPTLQYKPSWLLAPGQLSMADVVKMGRSDSKGSGKPFGGTEISYSTNNTAMLSASKQRDKHNQVSKPLQSEDHPSKGSMIIQEPSTTLNQLASSEEWPLAVKSPATRLSVLEPCTTSAVYADPFIHGSPKEDNGGIEILSTNCNGFSSASDRQSVMDFSEQDPFLHDSSLKDRSSHQGLSFEFEYREGTMGGLHASVSEYQAPSSIDDVGVAVSSVASSLQQLTFHSDELASSPKEDNRAVIIPDHLQVTTMECSHLSFGSFGSGVSAAFVSKTLNNNNLEESSPEAADASPVEQSDVRNPEYYDKEQAIFTSTKNNDSPSSLLPEIMKHDSSEEITNGNQYPIPSSMPGYAFKNTAETDALTESYAQAGLHLQNPAPFSSGMQVHTNPQPSHLSESAVQPVQESDLPYSQFATTQPVPTKYRSRGSSIGAQTMSIQETMKQSFFSVPQPPQAMLSNSMPTGPTIPQHLALQHLAQPTLPSGHFANMIGYPYLPQSYPYLPSVIQQAYATANSAYSQSPAALQNADVKYPLLQYKNSVPVGNLPQLVSSSYGLGGLTNSLGNSVPNLSNLSPSTSISYEGVTGAQFKASNDYMLQQSEGSGMWVQGPGSRTMSVLPASPYYNLHGQNQHNGVRHRQQPSESGAMGYSNFSHSQTGISQEHLQTLSNGTLRAPQVHLGQQLQQIWQ